MANRNIQIVDSGSRTISVIISENALTEFRYNFENNTVLIYAPNVAAANRVMADLNTRGLISLENGNVIAETASGIV